MVEKNNTDKTTAKTGDQLIHANETLQDKLETTEKSLHLLEKKFNHFIEKSKDIFFTISEENKLTYFSPRLAEALGYTISELLDKSLDMLLHPDDCPKHDALLKQIVSSGEKATIEFRIKQKNDTWRWYSADISPIKDQDAFHFLGKATDVTERKFREKALNRSEEKYNQLVENSNDLIYTMDLEGYFLFVNKAFRRILDYSHEDVLGKNVLQMVHPDDLELAKKGFNSAKDGKAGSNVELRYRAEDGSYLDMLVGASPVYDLDGNTIAVSGLAKDISLLKQAEADRLKLAEHARQIQKLDSLYLMAGSIAHNFNNLLLGVQGNLELAVNRLEKESPLSEFLNNAGEAAKRLADLSSLMLTYVGQGQCNSSVIDVAEIVTEMKNMLRASICNKAVLTVNLPGEPVPVKGDQAQIRQLIINLLSNAIEAVGAAGNTITVTVSKQFFNKKELKTSYLESDFADGFYVCLEVSDTGSGMDKETCAKAFDPFFSTRYFGRGMGLAAVLGIVRAHHGTVFLDSEPGKGTVVNVLFPTIHPPEEPKETRPQSTANFNGTVLLVDDEELVLDVGRDMLEGMGFRVITANDGFGAVEKFRAHAEAIVCVVMDMVIPGMDGAETFREMQNIRADIPVILCSGYSMEQVTKRFGDKRPAAFIAKPFHIAILAEEIRKLLDNKV
ncbi:MAG: PAS domain S-box protein [bacterium]|nr:PAS domain S-box protein [bacterium]